MTRNLTLLEDPLTLSKVEAVAVAPAVVVIFNVGVKLPALE
jgi:hypothetical protein